MIACCKLTKHGLEEQTEVHCKLAEQLGPEHDQWYRGWFEATDQVCTSEAILHTDLFNILINDTDIRQSTSSASLQMIQNWEKQMVNLRVVLPFTGTRTGQRDEQTNTIQEGVQSSPPGEEQTHSPAQAGSHLTGKYLCRKGQMDPRRHQVENMTAMCPCHRES